MEYLDFELAIEATTGGDYWVTVLDSPAGQTSKSEVVHFPFDQEQLRSRLGALHEALVRSRGDARDVVPNRVDEETGQKAAEEFGGALFEFLFPGDVRNLFVQSLRQAEEKPDRGLRVRFRTQAPELAVLPWELLYDRRPGNFVCLSNATPFVRFLPTQQPAGILTVTPPLRILGMVSSPPGLSALDASGEMARVDAALAESKKRGLVELTWLQGGSWQALTEALRSGSEPWHVFHFIGHGGFDVGRDGYLVLTTEQGERYDLSAMSLGNLLADHKSLRLVVLNACKGAQGSGGDLFSSTASTLVRRGLPAVVSMQQEISDKAALAFSKEFYRALAQGYPVDGAVAEARKSISLTLPESLEWATPMIHMRSPDGRLFAVASSSLETPPQAQAPRHQHGTPHTEGDSGESIDSSVQVRPSGTLSLGELARRIPWTVALLVAAVAALSATLLRDYLLPENVAVIGPVASLLAILGFIMTVASPWMFRRHLRALMGGALLLLAIVLVIQLTLVCTVTGYGPKADTHRFLVGFRLTSLADPLGKNRSCAEYIRDGGDDSIPGMWGASYKTIAIVYSLSYLAFVLCTVLAVGGTRIARPRGRTLSISGSGAALAVFLGLLSFAPGLAHAQEPRPDTALARAAELLNESPLLDSTMSQAREASFVRAVQALVSHGGQDTSAVGQDTSVSAGPSSYIDATRDLEEILAKKGTVVAKVISTPSGLTIGYRRAIYKDAPVMSATTDDTLSLQPALYVFTCGDSTTGAPPRQQTVSCATNCTVVFNCGKPR